MACALRHCILALAAALMALPAVAVADPPSESAPLLVPGEEQALLGELLAASPHRQAFDAALARGDLPPAPLPSDDARSAPPPPPPQPKSAWPKKPGRRFFGYLPYWTQKTAVVPWGALTQVAWFSAGLKTDATFSTVAGWGGADAKAFIDKAHGKGVQVVLCITLFNTQGISTLVATEASRKKAVDAIVKLVVDGGGDGVNIDFEGLAKADREPMKAFIALLNTTMKAALPGADVTLATPAVDWSGAWDYKYLAEHSDGLFIMAYAIHWGGGAPGPQLPMAAQKPWTHKTLQWVLDDYLKWATVANKAKIINGLPLYGMTWLSASKDPGVAKKADGKAIFYSQAQVAATAAGGWIWDKGSESMYFVKPSGADWLQTWCDDFKAFAMRVDYVDTRDVMLGAWALGYTDDDPEVMKKVQAWREQAPPVVTDGAKPDAGTTDTVDAAPDLPPPDVPPELSPAELPAVEVADAPPADLPAPDLSASDVPQTDFAEPIAPVDTTQQPDVQTNELDGLQPVDNIAAETHDATAPVPASVAPVAASGCTSSPLPGAALWPMVAGLVLAIARRRERS
jgi:spore germination protein YaaH